MSSAVDGWWLFGGLMVVAMVCWIVAWKGERNPWDDDDQGDSNVD